jgi:hypothetical protein
MMRGTSVLVAVCAALPLPAASQEAQLKTLASHLTVATSPNGLTTAVLGRQGAGAEPFLFCITHEAPVARRIDFMGPGKVTYRPQPISGLPPGIVIHGPETIAPMLALAPDSGAAMVFLQNGQQPPADASLRGAAAFRVAGVMRMDWAPPAGPRRGTDIEGCLSPGG